MGSFFQKALVMDKGFSSYQVITLFILLSFVGVFLAHFIPVSLNPDDNLPTLSITYNYPGASAAAVEQEVTSVIEGAVNTLSKVRSIHSQSQRAAGLVTLSFDRDIDMQLKWHEVLSVLRYTYQALPEGVGFPEVRAAVDASEDQEQPLLSYAISSRWPTSKAYPLIQKALVDVLSAMNGVEKVSLEGIRPKVLALDFDPDKMKEFGLSTTDLGNALGRAQNRSFLGNSNSLSANAPSLPILLEQRIGSMPQMLQVPVDVVGGRLVRFSELVDIHEEEGLRNTIYRVNGAPQVTLRIFANKGVNDIVLAKKVRHKVQDIQKKLGGDISLVLRKDHTTYLEKEIDKILACLGLSLSILLLLIVLIYRRWPYVAVILISLLVNVALALSCYYLFGVTLHLFSFAGITITFGMMLDNVIIMLDHVRYKKNRQVFRALLSATLTTIAALVMVFFLNDTFRQNLNDFAVVVAINLFTSLFVSFFLVPALNEKLIRPSMHHQSRSYRKAMTGLIRFNAMVFVWARRYRPLLFSLAVFAFGLPLFLLPDQLEGENRLANLYNKTVAPIYKGKVKQVGDQWLGGTLRWFVDHVGHQGFEREKEETRIRVMAQMPKGSTLQHCDEIMQGVERFLSQFKAFGYFETLVHNPEYATLDIYFNPSLQHTKFPLLLLNYLRNAITGLGSAEWSISGAGDGFSNATAQQTGQYRIYLYGFSYEKLLAYAGSLQESLEAYARVENVSVAGRATAFSNPSFNYVMKFDPEKLAWGGMDINATLTDFNQKTMKGQQQGQLLLDGQPVRLVMNASRQNFGLWQMNNNPVSNRGRMYRVRDFGLIQRESEEEGIFKMNQLYQLVLNFDFVGTINEGYAFLNDRVEGFRENLALGYTINTQPGHTVEERGYTRQLGYILLIIVVIYGICAILLESLWQPLAVIAMIPVSFIGAFIAFAWFEIDFGQGGYASMLLLTGLTVNPALYLINEFNNIKSGSKRYRQMDGLKGYVRAYNRKIVPILLTTISTILGLLPFLITGEQEGFWFSLAAGTIGGLCFSMVALYVYLPVFFIGKAGNQITGNTIQKILNADQ